MFAVEFIAVAMALADFELAVSLMRKRSGLQLARPRAEPHGTAHFVHAQQFAQFVNHAIRRLRIELGAVRLLQACNISSVFNRRALHAQANAEEGNFVLASKLNGINHALNAALAESARNQDTVVAAQA